MKQSNAVRDLLARAREQLTGSDSARLDAEILLAAAMNVPREALYAHPDDPVPPGPASDFWSLIAKRTTGFPVAYLTGHREFWSTELTVNRHTLIPRPETECLVETALTLIPENAAMNILDLGTGSGAIAIAIAGERPGCSVLAVDVVAESLCVAQANAMRLRLLNIHFRESDWFAGLVSEEFDMIVCNPPYVDSRYHGFTDGEISHEPRIALDGGHLGLEIINHLIPAAARHLRTGGYFILEHGYDQGPSIRDIFLTNNFKDVKLRQDYAGHERVSYGRLA